MPAPNPDAGHKWPRTGDLDQCSAAVSAAHARQRGPGERANTRLRSRRILRKVRCCPLRVTSRAKAILVLILAG